MSTYLQTLTVEYPMSEKTFFSIEKAPIYPPSFKAEEGAPFIVMKTDDECVIIWWNNGIIVKGYKDGTTKTWYPKPNLASAIHYSINPSNKSTYFEFHNDGSVTSSVNKCNYYWSAQLNDVPEIGKQVFGYLYDTNEYTDEELAQQGVNLDHSMEY